MCARGKAGLGHKYIPFVDSGRNSVSLGPGEEQTVVLIILANEKLYFYQAEKESLCSHCQGVTHGVTRPIQSRCSREEFSHTSGSLRAFSSSPSLQDSLAWLAQRKVKIFLSSHHHQGEHVAIPCYPDRTKDIYF